MGPQDQQTANGTQTSSEAHSEFPVIAIGASAGGIAALQTLFKSIQAQLDLAIVVVLHQMPEHPSQLTELIGKWSVMPVREAADGVKLERNCIFVAPAGQSLALERGTFATRQYDHDGPRPGIDSIDSFFESLALDVGHRAIGVILSGTGTDGAAGAVLIKQTRGMVLVQDPATATHDGMPTAAIASGCADHVLPLKLLAQELVACASPSYVRSSSGQAGDDNVSQALDGIFELVRTKAGFDLSGYKTTPLLWRVQRRMEFRSVPLFRDYEALLHDNPAELQALVRDIPVHVTEFFRDLPAWSTLEQAVLPDLFREASEGLRVWTPACATGEEAYSLGMLLAEHASTLDRSVDFQVFATDASSEIVARASRGIFRASALNALSLERRQKFFYAADGTFRVKRSLREKMVFAPQDLLADSPFPSLDLITCRNLLIYLEPDAARRVVSILHSALRTGGALFLGKSESLHWVPRGSFEEVSRGSRIYRKVGGISDLNVQFPKRPSRLRAQKSSRTTVEAYSHETVVATADVPAILVDDQLRILRIHGDPGPFVRFKPGEPSLNLLNLLRLPIDLEQVARQAFAGEGAVTVNYLPDPSTGELTLTLRLTPLDAPEGARSRLLVSFLPGGPVTGVTDLADLMERTGSPHNGGLDWSEALRVTREELDASREELQALNEELRASNDQLNIANEELSQANAQLRDKLEEIQTQSDVLASGAVMTLFLDAGLHVRWFTPGADELFPLKRGDTGRRITDLAPRFQNPAFLDQIRTVMETGAPNEAEVRSFAGRWYLQRIRPFRKGNGEGTGVAINFTDITERKRVEEDLADSRNKLAEDLADARELQKVSAALMEDDTVERLYDEILDAGIAILHAQFGSLQLLDHEKGELQLIAWRNFYPESIAFWQKVSVESGSACAAALHRSKRVVVQDLRDTEVIKDPETLRHYALNGVIAVQSTPLMTRAGRMVGMLATHWRERHEPSERDLALFDVLARQVADVIERRRAQDALRDSNERITKLVELIPAGVYTCDAEGRLTFANRRAVELWGRQPALGDDHEKFCGSFRMWTPEGSLLRHEDCPMAEAVQRGQSARNLEVVIEQPTGARLAASVNIDPLHDRDGRLNGAINVFIDITERKRAEERLRESEARYRELFKDR